MCLIIKIRETVTPKRKLGAMPTEASEQGSKDPLVTYWDSFLHVASTRPQRENDYTHTLYVPMHISVYVCIHI